MVLGIDSDHLDYYGSMGEPVRVQRFALMTQFMMIRQRGQEQHHGRHASLDRRAAHLLALRTMAIIRPSTCREYKPGALSSTSGEWSKVTGHIWSGRRGSHANNIYNAGHAPVCRLAGLTVEQCAEAAASFKGAGRRFEVYGECNGAVVVDDYAHHPTELRATLNTAKELGYKRLIAVHQPFTYSRTKMLFNDFVDVSRSPDIAVITPHYGQPQPNDPAITSAELAAQIPGFRVGRHTEEAADWVKQNAREGDLVITLGCGDIYKASKMMVAEN